MFSPSHTAMAARAFSTLNRPGMVSRNSRLYRGVLTWRLPVWAAASTRPACSQSRLTHPTSAWAKIRSLEEK